MTFVFDLPNEKLLPATFGVVEKIEAFVKTTNMAELRAPAKDGETTKDAARRVLRAMAKRACMEYPKETAEVTDSMWVLDEGETAPNSIVTFTKCVQRNDVMNFFISLVTLA